MKYFAAIALLFSSSLFGETYMQQPEAASGYQKKQPVYASRMMVSCANPHAAQAGFDILKEGGSAIDAAIAIQMVLNVVEPQSSGIGGGAFLLYYRNKEKKVSAYDGRETAPRTVKETLFLDENGMPLDTMEAIVGGKSVGVPGVLRMLELVHQKEGKLDWGILFAPAVELAEKGFSISPRLNKLIRETPRLNAFSQTREFLFLQNGKVAKPAGTILKNPELAETLRIIAERGIEPFYAGEIAQDIVQAVTKSKISGNLSLEDMASYRALIREPLVFDYRDFRIYGMPPPSSGGITVGQILGMLEQKKLKTYDLGSTAFINIFGQASRLAFADRNYYLADPDFFPVPTGRLLNKRYLKERSKEIDPARAIEDFQPGEWPGKGEECCPQLFSARPLEFPSTSQICVVDSEGNIVSMTTSVENAFGSTLFVRGFFLNNQLTDFSFLPEKDGVKVANRVEPGKRPLSSMSPTLVFHRKTHAPLLTVGAAGGTRIIDYVAQVLFGVLDFSLNIQEAIDFPHYVSIDRALELEKETFLVDKEKELREMGNEVKLVPLPSGLQGIQITKEGLIGGADPRREGIAIGE